MTYAAALTEIARLIATTPQRHRRLGDTRFYPPAAVRIAALAGEGEPSGEAYWTAVKRLATAELAG